MALNRTEREQLQNLIDVVDVEFIKAVFYKENDPTMCALKDAEKRIKIQRKKYESVDEIKQIKNPVDRRQAVLNNTELFRKETE